MTNLYSDDFNNETKSAVSECCEATGRAFMCCFEFFKYIACCDCFRSEEEIQKRRREDYIDVFVGDSLLTEEELKAAAANQGSVNSTRTQKNVEGTWSSRVSNQEPGKLRDV